MPLENLSEEELKKKKLIAEINSIEKPFYKQFYKLPNFWTFLVVLIATVYSWQSGLFETESKILELKTIQLNFRKDTLKHQIKNLMDQKKQLENKVESLNDSVDSLKTVIAKNEEEKTAIEKEKTAIKNEFDVWKQQIQSKRDLQKEVLGFTAEIKRILYDYKKEDRKWLYNKTISWERRNTLSDSLHTELFYKYNLNFKGKTIYYRDRMRSLLPDIKIEKFDQLRYEHPTNPLGIESVIDDLEFLAYKLTDIENK